MIEAKTHDSILRSYSGRRPALDQTRGQTRLADAAGGDDSPGDRRRVTAKSSGRKKSRCVILAGLLSVLTLSAADRDLIADKSVSEVLEPILRAHNLPALAGAIVTGKGLAAIGAVGVRKSGTDIAVTVDDGWHLGSDTKAMTAAMIGALVEQGKLTWETTIEQVFPDLSRPLAPALQKVTLLQLLSHRSGLPANILWDLIPKALPTREQRLAVLKVLASVKLMAEPGAEYLYSNLGYVVAAAMAETAADDSWENLMARTIFGPLGMTSVGYGGLGTPGRVDQPWAHLANGKPVAGNGPDWDNPPVMGPAGRAHCTLGDWATFIADQLRGARGEKALLKTETYRKLQTPPFGGDYALGWLVAGRNWGGGTVLTHAGSNSMNFAVVWIAPLRDFAVLVVTNQGGRDGRQGLRRGSLGLDRSVPERRREAQFVESREGREVIMPVTVERLGVEHAGFVLEMVQRLLTELGEEGDELGPSIRPRSSKLGLEAGMPFIPSSPATPAAGRSGS